MRSSQMHGDDMPAGSAVFHRRFVVGPNSTGGLSESDTPAQFVPRNCGHATAPSARWQASVVVAAKQSTGTSRFNSAFRIGSISLFGSEMSSAKATVSLEPVATAAGLDKRIAFRHFLAACKDRPRNRNGRWPV